MSFAFLAGIFLKLTNIKIMFLYLVLMPYVFKLPENIWDDTKKYIYIFSAIMLLVVLKLFYGNESSLEISQYALRMFFLFSMSMLSFSAIDFDQIFIYLMSIKKLKVEWGYSLLLAMNSLKLLMREQERITYNAKLRNLKWHQRYLTFFPVLVFAIRHSERGAMALVTRGLNSDKLFYYVRTPKTRDHVILGSYLFLTATFFLVG
jgi:energy-coupling factor transporter transmembrane protein EcfT